MGGRRDRGERREPWGPVGEGGLWEHWRKLAEAQQKPQVRGVQLLDFPGPCGRLCPGKSGLLPARLEPS